MISSWVRKVLIMAVLHMSLGTLQGAATSAALVAEVNLVSTLPAGYWAEFILHLDIIFIIYHYYKFALGSCETCCPGPY